MSGRFITFRPTTGAFRKAIDPYKKWYERADMSPLVEVDGKHYRILRTTGILNKIGTRKLVISNEKGQLIKDKAITKSCIEAFILLTPFLDDGKGIIASGKDDGSEKKLASFIREFNIMLENVTPHLTEEELGAMTFHLHYYKEMKRLAKLVAEEARQLLPYLKPLKNHQMEVLSASFMNKLNHYFTEWETKKGYVEALMIEDGLKARTTIRNILRNTDYQSCFPNRKIKEQMIAETYEAENAVKRFIYDGKHEWEYEAKWINDDRGKFTVKKFLHYLYHQDPVELYKKANTIEILQKHWIFSPKCIYL